MTVHNPINPRNSGSGFLSGDNQTIWAARHSFLDRLQAHTVDLSKRFPPEDVWKRLLSEPFPVKIALYDAQGKILFDTRNGRDFVTIKSILPNSGLIEELEKQMGWQAMQLADWIEFRLSRPLDRPAIARRTTPLRQGEMVYSLGYPDKTETRRSRLGVPDSDGIRLFVTKGQVITAAQGSRHEDLAKLSAEKRSALLAELDRYFLFHTADIAPGSSGGPLVDAEGRLVGQVLIKYNADPKDSYSRTGVFAPRREVIDLLVKP